MAWLDIGPGLWLFRRKNATFWASMTTQAWLFSWLVILFLGHAVVFVELALFLMCPYLASLQSITLFF